MSDLNEDGQIEIEVPEPTEPLNSAPQFLTDSADEQLLNKVLNNIDRRIEESEEENNRARGLDGQNFKSFELISNRDWIPYLKSIQYIVSPQEDGKPKYYGFVRPDGWREIIDVEAEPEDWDRMCQFVPLFTT